MARTDSDLRHRNRHEPLTGIQQSHTASGAISSGPWIISLISIPILGALLTGILASREQQLILSSLTYIFAFMLILTGALALVMTRFAADAYSEKRSGKILPSYLGALTVSCTLAAFAAGAFFIFGVTASPFFQLAAIALSILVAATFITASYLGALKHDGSILASFLGGYTLSCGLAYLLVRHQPLEPALALAGFVVGHLVLFLMLFADLCRELPPGRRTIDFSCVRYVLGSPALVLCGLCFHAGIWIDKLLFWGFAPDHTQVNGAIFSAPDYDVAVYLAILSIVPGMAVFCLRLQTDFAKHFTKYFQSLNGTGTLNVLQTRKDRITRTLRDGVLLLLRVQGTTTVILLIFAEDLTRFLHLGVVQVGVIRITLLGAFFLVLFLAHLTILFYCDDRRGALTASGILLATNTGITLASLLSSQVYYGIGFALASCFAFAFTAARASHLLAGLEFRIFTTDHPEPIDPVPDAIPTD